jgi:uncharacterized protein YbaR (Trm112 family)
MEKYINVTAKCPICGKDLEVVKDITLGANTRFIDFEIGSCPDCSNKLSLLEERVKELENKVYTKTTYISIEDLESRFARGRSFS